MRKATLPPGQHLRSVHREKSLLLLGGLYNVLSTGNPPLKVPPGERKINVNSYRRRTMHRGKVEPGVSELPRDNELARDHVDRPLHSAAVV